jgi:hypothetical protein
MSFAGVSFASVTIAESDFRSVDAGADGGINRTASTLRIGGNRDFITAGDVPGGSDERCNVGLGATCSAALPSAVVLSSSSEV